MMISFQFSTYIFRLLIGLVIIGSTLVGKAQDSKNTYYLGLSEDILRAVKNGDPTGSIEKELAGAPRDDLAKELDSDPKKLAFWINIYNAQIQIILSQDPELFKDRGDFFGEDRITIAGQKLSFDKIEHGLIRNSKGKLSTGKLFVGDFEERFRVTKVDPRIHFALNCGAKSCPYIAIYDHKVLDEQLDLTSKQYVNRTTEFKGNVAHVSRLFSWFRNDFGGKDGIREFLKKYDAIPPNSDPELEFKSYDWTLDLGNYKDLNIRSENETH